MAGGLSPCLRPELPFSPLPRIAIPTTPRLAPEVFFFFFFFDQIGIWPSSPWTFCGEGKPSELEVNTGFLLTHASSLAGTGECATLALARLMVLVSSWERPHEDSVHLFSGLTVETEASKGHAVGTGFLCSVFWFLIAG